MATSTLFLSCFSMIDALPLLRAANSNVSTTRKKKSDHTNPQKTSTQYDNNNNSEKEKGKSKTKKKDRTRKSFSKNASLCKIFSFYYYYYYCGENNNNNNLRRNTRNAVWCQSPNKKPLCLARVTDTIQKRKAPIYQKNVSSAKRNTEKLHRITNSRKACGRLQNAQGVTQIIVHQDRVYANEILKYMKGGNQW